MKQPYEVKVTFAPEPKADDCAFDFPFQAIEYPKPLFMRLGRQRDGVSVLTPRHEYEAECLARKQAADKELRDFVAAMRPLGADFEAVWDANIDTLYQE